MRPDPDPQKTAEEFNDAHKLGDVVHYAEVMGDPMEEREIAGPAFVMGGHSAMVRFKGKTGCYSVQHCQKIPATHLLISVEKSRQGQPLTAFWRPEGRGYTTKIDEAGRYTKKEAEATVGSSLASVTIECRHCRGRSLTWQAHPVNKGSVVDGRICMREIAVEFFLGCDECSETLHTLTGDEVALYLTETLK